MVHFLEQCLLSCQAALEGIDAEIFVVDNNSVDGSQEMVREKFPNVHFIANKDNVGFSKANNQAIEIAQGKYVLLLNPDTIVEETTFTKVVDFMESHPDAGALGVKMIDGEGKFLPESKRGLPSPWVAFYKIFGFSRLFPKSRRFGRYHLSYLDDDQDHEVEVLSGAFMLLRKDVLDKIGYLDETFFMYGEDIDLSYRVIKAGYKNYYFAGTKIIHYKGESTKKGSLNYVRVFYNAMIIFAKKHFSKGKMRFFIFFINLAVYFRAFLAVGTRIIKKIWFPLLEAGFVYATIIGIKEYWEYFHKLLKDGIPYPKAFDYVAAPIYTIVIIGFMTINGAYKKPYKLKPIFIAASMSFIAIATVSFIWSSINFSRAIVGLASISSIFIALITRGVINLVQTGSFFFNEEPQKRVVITGEMAEATRIKKMVEQELNYAVSIEGVVITSPETQPVDHQIAVLGTADQLQEIVQFYKIDEVIFSNKGMSTEQIIGQMAQIQRDNLTYKIVPPDVNYLVGPHVIHSSLYGDTIPFPLQRKELKVKKRLFDVAFSWALISSFPLHFWLYRKPGIALKHLFQVLFGEKHLVGYIRTNPDGLPKIKEGVLSMMDRVKSNKEQEAQHSYGLDRHYARSYSLGLDFEILFKGIRKLGEIR